MTYAIFEGNMEKLEKKLNRIFNKCKNYGCDFHYEQVGETFKELKDENGKKYTARFVLVEADGKAIINDWEFVAQVDHTEKGNIITGFGIEVPERYYTSKPVCEHCNSNRYRKNTYIVRNIVTGEFKQVGKSCLRDFTHGMSAEAVAQYMSLFDNLIEGEAPMQGCYIKNYIKTTEYLAFAAETIKHFGFSKTSDDGVSTSSKAIDFYDAAHGCSFPREYMNSLREKMIEINFNIESPSTVKLVKDALDWINEQTESSNYIHNLKTACSLEYITGHTFGLLASLFPAFDKDLEKQQERKQVQDAENSSQFVGQIKDRITVNMKSIKCVTGWETEFGYTYIYKMIGEDGNVYTWKTTKVIDESEEVLITGTVKNHNEFRGIKQTELTRCRVAA